MSQRGLPRKTRRCEQLPPAYRARLAAIGSPSVIARELRISASTARELLDPYALFAPQYLAKLTAALDDHDKPAKTG